MKNNNFIKTLKATLIACTEITIPDKENFVFNVLLDSLSTEEYACIDELKVFSNVNEDLSNVPLKLYDFVMRKMDTKTFDTNDNKITMVLEMFNTVNWLADHESKETAYKLCNILARLAKRVEEEGDQW